MVSPTTTTYVCCLVGQLFLLSVEGFVLKARICSQRISSGASSVKLYATKPNTTTTMETSGASLTLNATADSISSARFGDVVSLRKSRGEEVAGTDRPSNNEYMMPATESNDALAESKQRNLLVAVASVALAVSSYVWQFTHPIAPVQLLFGMQQTSQPITVIGANQRPTVVDFWAPWCENCKLMAPTLRQVEEEYKDRVNFVMVNGNQAESWPLIERFGVDAIPHLALVSAEGDVETALIGPIPRGVLAADLNIMLENAKHINNDVPQPHQTLPYQMLDVFAGNPEGRRIRFQ